MSDWSKGMSEARERLAVAQEGRRQRGLHPKGTDQTYEEQTRVLMTWTKDELVRSLIREESDKLKAIDQLIDAKTAQAVSLPDRETILKAIASRLSWPSLHWDWSSPDAHAAIADAVLTALSAQPAAGEPLECDHEFTDHCVFCGVDAHEWYNHDAVKA